MESDIILQATIAAREYHMHMGTYENDGRDYARKWSAAFRDVIASESADFVHFLQKPREDYASEITRKEFIAILSNGTLSPQASWWKTNLVDIPMYSAVDAIDHELGMSLTELQNNLHSAMDLYKKTVTELFTLDATLSKNIKCLNVKSQQLLQLRDLEENTPECLALQNSILDYIHSQYKYLSIESDYHNFCKTYARFSALRSILSTNAPTSTNSTESQCAICNKNELSTALIPCGHVYCGDCARMQQTHCYICRCSITDRLRIFFN